MHRPCLLLLPALLASGLVVTLAGCGGVDARRTRASEALESTRVALVDLDARTSGGETSPEVRAALDGATARLEEAEHALDLWVGSTGRLAYDRMAACLAAALDTLRGVLTVAGIHVSMELETAEVALGTTTDRVCASRSGRE